jgi:predicted RND superfamily exporter protein
MTIRDATRTVEEVGHPLLITSLTTVAGFLPLLLARHRGIRSLGVVTCVGSVTMLLTAVVLMPAMLALLDRSRNRGSRTP